MAQRFPLIARWRPACLPLPQRVASIVSLADSAVTECDSGLASTALNQTALLFSDVGDSDLARDLCHRHTAAYLHACPQPSTTVIRALEPVVNLARLLIRAGRPDEGRHHLLALYEAVSAGASARIENIDVPAGLTRTAQDQQEVRAWLWRVLLADATRALTTAGRWADALNHLKEHRGVGKRMLDGRQVAVLAAFTSGDADGAAELLAATAPGELWENAVAAVLSIICRGRATNAEVGDVLKLCDQIPAAAGLDVFHTRLRLALVDALGEHNRVPEVCQDVISRACASGDGYAARDVLLHPVCRAVLQPTQQQALTDAVGAAGLGQRSIPADLHADLLEALGIAETVILQTLDPTSV